MIKHKKKPCKGIGKAKDFKGCGKEIFKRVHGLCQSCYSDWLMNTPEGLEKLSRAALKATKKKKTKKSDHPEIYHPELKADLQRAINKIVRLIDKNVPCIDCGRTEANPCWDAGHRKSRGAHPSIRYNLHNIFIQTRYCNSKSEGDKKSFDLGISSMYGEEYFKKVDQLPLKYKELKINHSELPSKIAEARKIVRELEKIDQTYPPKLRIELREKYNKRLGIYK